MTKILLLYDPMTSVLNLITEDVERDAKLARSEQVLRDVTAELEQLNKRIGLASVTRLLWIDFDGYQNEIEVHVQYRAYPARAALLDEPGSCAYVEIVSVLARGKDITGLLGSEIQQAMAEDICEGLE